MSDDREHRFRDWACAKGYDVAYTYDTERSRHVWLNPMTNDLWGAWQAASAQSGWRPIAEAPKDGTKLLLWATRNTMLVPTPEVVSGWYANGWWGDESTLSHVTHWQPLPDAPRSSV